MPDSSFIQASFLGGEISPYAQGRTDSPSYRTSLNVCRNSYPLEEGAWIRRSGSRFVSTTLNGAEGRVIHFDFEQTSPYIMEFTDGFLRFFAVSTQTSGLTSALPADFRLVTTNDNQPVAAITTSNPAQVNTTFPSGWVTGDQIEFLFDTSVDSGFTPLLRNRTFKITVLGANTFSISDPITGATIDGSTLGWSTPAANTVIVVRNLTFTTPYTAGDWADLRRVQAETQAVLLHNSFNPRNLQVTTLPTSSTFASFSLSNVSLLDGPYLDPPTDGTILSPNLTAATTGTLPATQGWNAITANGSLFLAIASGSTVGATATDGVTWTSRTLPFAASKAVTSNGTIFVLFGTGTNVATSADGITWVTHVLPVSANIWTGVAWNGTVFCACGFNANVVVTSPDGITWTNQTGWDTTRLGQAIAWNGTVFCIPAFHFVGLEIFADMATSPDGITWTKQIFPSNAPFCPAITAKGSTFCMVCVGSSVTFFSTDNGVTWFQETLPSVSSWSGIASNGTVFCAVASGLGNDATSTDGITWTTHALSTATAWSAIAWNGTIFCIIASGTTISSTSTNGVFSALMLTASGIAPINKGLGFVSTDVGRSIRLHSEPLSWFVGTTYSTGNAVKFNGVYFIALAATTGNQPDISPTKWSLSTAAATWTWATIQTVNSPLQVTVIMQGPDLIYTTVPIVEWRLGVFSDTTGYPSCGTYYEGRLWLSGAVANRVDSSKVNDLFNMEPTGPDGTVADDSAISYIFNSSDVNPIFWMNGTNSGIVCGTQAGEWLISAPTTGPITATNIQAHRGTTYGSTNIEAENTQLTLSFVQRYDRTLLEYFPDVFSGRFVAPSLTENAKHLTQPGIGEIRYQQELLPIIWNRILGGGLVGATYERDNLFSSQPAKFIGWHRHDLGSDRSVESIAVGPSEDGNIDALAMVTNGSDDEVPVRHVELMQKIFEVNSDITAGWFLDDAIVPSGGVITASGVNSTIAFYGLWHLNGKTVTLWVGGIDVGDFTVSNGSITAPIDADLGVGYLFTSAYLLSISSTTLYGARACPIDGSYGRITVPVVVGFTYTSQGQIVRPDTLEQTRSQTGMGSGKPRRMHSFAALFSRTQGVSFGTTFTDLHAAQFKSPGGTKALSLLQLFDGVYWQQVDDTWGLDSMICWQISRPYPTALASLTGFLESTDR